MQQAALAAYSAAGPALADPAACRPWLDRAEAAGGTGFPVLVALPVLSVLAALPVLSVPPRSRC